MSKLEGIEITDLQTGEIITVNCKDVGQLIQCIKGTSEKLDRAIVKAPLTSKNEEFIQMSQKGLKAASRKDQLSGCDNKIWEYCCGDAGYGGKIKSTQAEIAKELDITPSRINRAFKRLRESGMIVYAGLEKGTPTFSIAAAYGIKGKRDLDGTGDMCNVIRMEDARSVVGRR